LATNIMLCRRELLLSYGWMTEDLQSQWLPRQAYRAAVLSNARLSDDRPILHLAG